MTAWLAKELSYNHHHPKVPFFFDAVPYKANDVFEDGKDGLKEC